MTVTDYKAFIRANPDLDFDEVQAAFPSVSAWDLRRTRRDIQRALDASAASGEQIDLSTLSKGGMNAVRAGMFRPVSISLTDREPVKPMFKRAGEQHLVMSDAHAPETDLDALDVGIQISQAVELDSLTLAGDWMDVGSLSSHLPAANRPFRWVDERTEALKILAKVREAHPYLPINYLMGNHEDRAERFLASQAPQLQGLFPLKTLLGLDDLNFIYPDDNRVLLANDQVMVMHGNKVRGESGQSVASEVRDAGMSVIMGHVHRLGYVPITKTVQTLSGRQPWVGVELGHLMNPRPSYVAVERTANWQQGCALVTVYTNGYYNIELIPIFNGTGFFRGRMFQSRLKKKVG